MLLCYAKRVVGHVKVEIFSGTPMQQKECDIDVTNGADIRHIITLQNLDHYPVDVSFHSGFPANSSYLSFQSVRPNDPNTTPSTWRDGVKSLLGKARKDFFHVRLVGQPIGSGHELINTDIEVFDHPSQTTIPESCSITVNLV